MSIPPLLSSSPPPLEENGSICNDDFGDFSDYASVGAVSSAVSVNESSSAFRPIDSAEISSDLYLGDSDLKATNLQEGNEWSAFDSAAVQPSSETAQTDSIDSFPDETLAACGSLSGDAYVGENPRVCDARESNTIELSNVSPSPSPVIVSEQINSEDVSDSCCDDENSRNEELTAQKFDSDLCANVNTLSVDANPSCIVEEILKDEESSSVGNNCDHEFDNDVDLLVQENDIEDYNIYEISSTLVISDRSDVADNNQPSSEEDDFADNFQSFSSDTELHEHAEAQLRVSNREEIACHSAYSQPEGTSSETDFASSDVKDSATAADQDEIEFTDQLLTHEQTLKSNEEVDDDFDDFEEFVAAKQEPAEHTPIADSTTYEWNAFDNTAADGDEWAAFQDSNPPQTTNLCSEVATVNVTDVQQPPVTYSDRLSKDSLSQSLYACFQSAAELESDAVINPLHHTFECPDAGLIINNSKLSKEPAAGVELWNSLRVMEHTPALKYQWHHSRCSDLLLHAIDIDARNILNPPRKSAAPAFATNLGLLEPKKAVSDPFISAGVDSTNTIPHGNLPFRMEHVQERQADVMGSSRPVDVKKQQKELLEVLELPTQNPKSRSSPLDSILKAITSSATTSNSSIANTATMKDGTTEPLSAEASAVMSRLPDLSFMHSKVLMFPVSDCAN